MTLSLFNFEISSGQVSGFEHRRRDKASQDAMAIAKSGGSMIAIICDGCGSSPYSAVGATLGAKIILSELQKVVLDDSILKQDFWSKIHQQVLKRLRLIAGTISGDIENVVSEYFLFTTVIAVLTKSTLLIAAIGDGYFGVNDQVYDLGPFAQNCPPYLGYSLLSRYHPLAQNFRIAHTIPASSLRYAFIGSDGLKPALEGDEKVKFFSEIVTSDLVYRNPQALNRYLQLKNNQKIIVDWENEILIQNRPFFHDDTSIVLFRARGADSLFVPIKVGGRDEALD